MIKALKRLSAFMVFTMIAAGCAPKVYTVDAPEQSSYRYQQPSQPVTSNLSFVDARENADMDFSYGVLPMGLTFDGSPLQPVDFLEKFTLDELQARGINVNASNSSDTKIAITDFEMRNYRSNGFAPFTTTSLLAADVDVEGKSERIVVFVKRGKVPVWTFDEIVEPTLNQPLEILVGEFSAKLNGLLYDQSLPDQAIDELLSKIDSQADGNLSYLNVYQLGFSNNPKALNSLVNLTNNEDEYVRLAAISSLGTLGAGDQVDLLVSIFEGDGPWQDRAMAVKSLGDLGLRGNDAAMKYLTDDIEAKLDGVKKTGAAWTRAVLKLIFGGQ